jgi:hypothetical protein
VRGNAAAAFANFEQAVEICHATGDKLTLAEALCNSALVDNDRSATNAIRERLTEALQFAVKNKIMSVSQVAVAGFAQLAFLEGQIEASIERLSVVTLQRASLEAQLWLEPLHRRLVAKLGREALEEKLAGQATTLDEVVRQILNA